MAWHWVPGEDADYSLILNLHNFCTPISFFKISAYITHHFSLPSLRYIELRYFSLAKKFKGGKITKKSLYTIMDVFLFGFYKVKLHPGFVRSTAGI